MKIYFPDDPVKQEMFKLLFGIIKSYQIDHYWFYKKLKIIIERETGKNIEDLIHENKINKC